MSFLQRWLGKLLAYVVGGCGGWGTFVVRAEGGQNSLMS